MKKKLTKAVMQKDKKEYFLTIDCLTKLAHQTPKSAIHIKGMLTAALA